MGIARTSPELFVRRMPADTLKITVTVLFVSAMIMLLDRWLLQPYQIVDAKSAAVAVIVVVIVIVTSFVFMFGVSILLPLTLKDNERAVNLADAWTMMFSFVWFLSGMLCLIDLAIRIFADANKGPFFAVLFWLGTGRDFVFGLKGERLLPCAGYSLMAYSILWLRTYSNDRKILTFGNSALSFLILVPFCTLMMYFAIWFSFDNAIARAMLP